MRLLYNARTTIEIFDVQCTASFCGREAVLGGVPPEGIPPLSWEGFSIGAWTANA